MRPGRHWSERLVCGLCGKSFQSTSAEAIHRHNVPALCRSQKKLAKKKLMETADVR